MDKISFVIPCYRSALTIRKVVSEIRDLMDVSKDFEIILVNDGSPDDTLDVIKKLCAEDFRIKAVNLAKNSGQPAATLAGFAHVSGKYVVYADDDGQTPLSDTFILLDKLKTGFDVVFARYEKREGNFYQRVGSKINGAMACYLLNKPRGLHLGNFWVCHRFVVAEAVRCQNPFPYLAGLLLSITRNITDVPVQQRQRIHGQSNYTFRKMLSLWVNGFTAFSVKPLRVATFVGFLCSFTGFSFMIVLIVARLRNPTMAIGYSSLMSVLLFLGGILMLMLGLIGEYVGRIYININQVPQYVVKERINF